MVGCWASRPATIPAAFIQGAFNGPEPTRTGAAPIPQLAAAFKAKVADLCLRGGVFSARAVRRSRPSANRRAALLLSQQNSGFISVKRIHLASCGRLPTFMMPFQLSPVET